MSRRRRRRRNLAAPFVVTTALGACGPGSQPAPEPATPVPAEPAEPATYDQNGEPITDGATPSPSEPPTAGQLPDPPEDGKGNVVTRDDGTCWYYEEVNCPPEATCNPPPPMQVKCPADAE